MKASVLDILIYLFENYMDGARDRPQPERGRLREELERAGFDAADVSRALVWLEGLSTTARVRGARRRSALIHALH